MTTFKPWEYRAEAGFVKGTDLTGYTVVAVDGDLGHVEAEYDGRPAYLDVDVGSWLGHDVALPVGLVERIDATKRTVYVDRTKDQIQHAPRFHDEVDYWERLGSYYSGTYMPPGGQMWSKPRTGGRCAIDYRREIQVQFTKRWLRTDPHHIIHAEHKVVVYWAADVAEERLDRKAQQ